MNLGRLRALPAVLLLAVGASAQDAPWTAGDIQFSGYVDGYYSFNFNHPASGNNGNVRYFDRAANQFSLNMAGLYMSVDPKPIGATLQLGYGRGWDLFFGTEPGDNGVAIQRYIPQAYITVAPENWGGFTFDFGKFVTSAAAELTETYSGWNYSRSLMYSNGPFYHMGARMAKPIAGPWTMGFQVVNGWNNVNDNNSNKTIGITSALAGEKVSLYNVYYGGVETSAGEGWRHYFDTVLNITPNDDFSAYLTYDVGVDKGDYGLDRGNNNWWGFGAAARQQLTPAWAVAGRYEYYNDIDGLITGAAQHMQEFTSTLEYKVAQGFLMRFEYRRDWSDVPYYDRGNEIASSKNADTLGVGFVAYFGAE